MAEERRTPEAGAPRQQELDSEVEDLTRRIADVINTAGAEQRQDLREYALGLLKEETEVQDEPAPASRSRRSTNPLGMAVLLGVVAVPLALLFAPVGLTLLAVAAVLGVWGVVAILVRR